MSEWSSKFAERLKSQQNAKEAEDAVFVEKQKLKKASGPALWQEVIKETKAHCAELNKDMGAEVAVMSEGSGWINVEGKTRNEVRRLVADFNSDSSLLKWDVAASSKKYELSVGSNGQAAFYPLNAQGHSLITVPSSPKSIAEEMLNALFFGLFAELS